MTAGSFQKPSWLKGVGRGIVAAGLTMPFSTLLDYSFVPSMGLTVLLAVGLSLGWD